MPKVYAQERDREKVKAYNAANHVVRYAKLRNDPVLWRAEKDRIRSIVARKRLFLKIVKETCGCVDCGTREGRLDLDHRDGTEKCFNPSQGPRYSWPRMVAEIMKCDVRCVPCHSRRHGLSRGGLNDRIV